MELEIKNKNHAIQLSSLKAGEVFKIVGSGNNRYVKAELSSSDYIHMSGTGRELVVNLETGGITCPVKTLGVIRVKAKVICDD